MKRLNRFTMGLAIALMMTAISPAPTSAQVSVVAGGYRYWPTSGNLTGNYIFGGLGITYKLSPKLSVIGGTSIQAAPEFGAWGPNIWSGIEFPAGRLFIDLTIGGIKDVGDIPSPWIVGPGISVLKPTKNGSFGPMVAMSHPLKKGTWFFTLGFSVSAYF